MVFLENDAEGLGAKEITLLAFFSSIKQPIECIFIVWVYIKGMASFCFCLCQRSEYGYEMLMFLP